MKAAALCTALLLAIPLGGLDCASLGDRFQSRSANTAGSDSGSKLSMNVSPEANAAFMRELEREDSQRYERLLKNIQTAAIRSGRSIEHRSHQAASMRTKAAVLADVPEAA